MIFNSSYKNKTDEELVAIACRDNKALSELYERYVEKIYRFAYYKTSDIQTAQDLTSETFINVIKSLHTFRQESSFKNYVFAICKFKIADYYREKYKTEPLDEFEIEDNNTDLDNIDETIIKEQENFKRLVSSLPKEDQELLTLRFENGLKITDIATNLNLTESNVKVKISRAINKLKEIYIK